MFMQLCLSTYYIYGTYTYADTFGTYTSAYCCNSRRRRFIRLMRQNVFIVFACGENCRSHLENDLRACERAYLNPRECRACRMGYAFSVVPGVWAGFSGGYGMQLLYFQKEVLQQRTTESCGMSKPYV